MNLKRLFLYSLIASVAICALLGIIVLVFGAFGELGGKVLATSFTVTCMSILGLGCGAYYETKGKKLMPFAGIAFAVLASGFVMVWIWFSEIAGDIFGRITVTATMLAITCALLSLISLATLDRRFAWSRMVAMIAAVLLDAILLWLLWFQPEGDGDIVTRVIGILSIVLSSMVVVTPVFHKLSSGEPTADKLDAEIAQLRTRLAELEAKRAGLTHNDAE